MSRFTAEIAPSAQAIGLLTDDVSDFLQGAGVDARAVHHVALVIDEILTNVATHGRCPEGPATVVIEVQADQVSGEIGDIGRPFDPRTAPAPDLAAPLDERKIGGLGLHLVRQLTSALEYLSDGKQNRTKFCVPRARKA